MAHEQTAELRLLLRIADLEGRLARLSGVAHRLVEKSSIPEHVTSKHYSVSDTKRVPARALVTLRNTVRAMEQGAPEE